MHHPHPTSWPMLQKFFHRKAKDTEDILRLSKERIHRDKETWFVRLAPFEIRHEGLTLPPFQLDSQYLITGNSWYLSVTGQSTSITVTHFTVPLLSYIDNETEPGPHDAESEIIGIDTRQAGCPWATSTKGYWQYDLLTAHALSRAFPVIWRPGSQGELFDPICPGVLIYSAGFSPYPCSSLSVEQTTDWGILATIATTQVQE